MLGNRHFRLQSLAREIGNNQYHSTVFLAQKGIFGAWIKLFRLWIHIHQIEEIAFSYSLFLIGNMQHRAINLA